MRFLVLSGTQFAFLIVIGSWLPEMSGAGCTGRKVWGTEPPARPWPGKRDSGRAASASPSRPALPASGSCPPPLMTRLCTALMSFRLFSELLENIIQTGARGFYSVRLIHRNLMYACSQNQIYHLWDPVQNENVGPLTQNLLKLPENDRNDQVGGPSNHRALCDCRSHTQEATLLMGQCACHI